MWIENRERKAKFVVSVVQRGAAKIGRPCVLTADLQYRVEFSSELPIDPSGFRIKMNKIVKRKEKK